MLYRLASGRIILEAGARLPDPGIAGEEMADGVVDMRPGRDMGEAYAEAFKKSVSKRVHRLGENMVARGEITDSMEGVEERRRKEEPPSSDPGGGVIYTRPTGVTYLVRIAFKLPRASRASQHLPASTTRA